MFLYFSLFFWEKYFKKEFYFKSRMPSTPPRRKRSSSRGNSPATPRRSKSSPRSKKTPQNTPKESTPQNTPKESPKRRTPPSYATRRLDRDYVEKPEVTYARKKRIRWWWKAWFRRCVFVAFIALLYKQFVSPNFDYDLLTFEESDLTLREYMQKTHEDGGGINLAMGPVFFGFYSYVGILSGLHDTKMFRVSGATGSSAGAIAGSIFCSPKIDFRRAKEAVSKVGLSEINDFPGFFAMFKGDKAAEIFSSMTDVKDLENCAIPFYPYAFDLFSMKGVILKKGNVARATLASATFPGLFSPIFWRTVVGENNDSASVDEPIVPKLKSMLRSFRNSIAHANYENAVYQAEVEKNRLALKEPLVAPEERFHWFIDGGIIDHMGDLGLSALPATKHVVHMTGSSFLRSHILPANNAETTLSIVITKIPKIGPFSMEKGREAMEKAEAKLKDSMDTILLKGHAEGHYILPLNVMA